MLRRLASFVLALPLLASAAVPAHAAPAAHADPWKTYATLVAREDTLYFANKFPACIALLDSMIAAGRASKDAGLERLALARRARVALLVTGFDDGLAFAGRSLALAVPARDTLTRIAAMRIQAIAYERTSRLERAVETSRLGVALARRVGAVADETYFELRLGYAGVAQNRPAEAQPHFLRAARLAEKAGHEGNAMRALSGLADTEYQLRELEPAREHYDRALALATKRGDDTQLAYLSYNRANMENSIGDPEQGARFAQTSLEAARRAGDLARELGATHTLVQFDIARGAWDRVDSIMTVAIPRAEPVADRDALTSLLLSGARAKIELGRAAEAEPLLRRATALVDSLLPMQAAFNSHLLVYVLHLAGKDEDAVRYADELCEKLSRRMPAEGYWRVRLYRGLALLELGRGREALVAFREAVERTKPTAEVPRGGLEHDWAIALVGEAQRQLGQIDASIASYRRSIAAWERERSTRTREDLLLDSEDYGSDIGLALAFALLDPRRAVRTDRRVIEAFTEVQRFHALSVSERLLGPAAGAAARRATFDLAAWRTGTLRPGEVFVDITPGEDSTLVVAVSRRDVRAWTIGSRDAIEKRLGRFSEMLGSSGADDATVRQVATALGADLLGPGADLLRGAKRVLIAAGRWSGEPLGSLIVPGMSGPLALERELSAVPSAKLLAIARARTGALPASQRSLVAVARTEDDRGRKLVAAGEEVRALGRDYRGAIALVDPPGGATKLARETLASGAIMHVAAHASVDERKPWQSRLLLGAPGGRDSWLAVSAISRLKLTARLCVLASCRSLGTGGIDNSALGGLAPAWLMAGVPTVIATQWDVDDRATAEFMRRFYAALAGGRAVGAALQQAQREMRAIPEWSAPRYWAGFVVLGDPGTHVTLSRR